MCCWGFQADAQLKTAEAARDAAAAAEAAGVAAPLDVFGEKVEDEVEQFSALDLDDDDDDDDNDDDDDDGGDGDGDGDDESQQENATKGPEVVWSSDEEEGNGGDLEL